MAGADSSVRSGAKAAPPGQRSLTLVRRHFGLYENVLGCALGVAGPQTYRRALFRHPVNRMGSDRPFPTLDGAGLYRHFDPHPLRAFEKPGGRQRLRFPPGLYGSTSKLLSAGSVRSDRPVQPLDLRKVSFTSINFPWPGITQKRRKAARPFS